MTGEGGVEEAEPCLKDRLTIPGSSSIADTPLRMSGTEHLPVAAEQPHWSWRSAWSWNW